MFGAPQCIFYCTAGSCWWDRPSSFSFWIVTWPFFQSNWGYKFIYCTVEKPLYFYCFFSYLGSRWFKLKQVGKFLCQTFMRVHLAHPITSKSHKTCTLIHLDHCVKLLNHIKATKIPNFNQPSQSQDKNRYRISCLSLFDSPFTPSPFISPFVSPFTSPLAPCQKRVFGGCCSWQWCKAT